MPIASPLTPTHGWLWLAMNGAVMIAALLLLLTAVVAKRSVATSPPD